jgi:hypothetical protein
MKKYICLSVLIVTLICCGSKYNVVADTCVIPEVVQHNNFALNYEVSLASVKKERHPYKHSGCGTYHKKKYE